MVGKACVAYFSARNFVSSVGVSLGLGDDLKGASIHVSARTSAGKGGGGNPGDVALNQFTASESVDVPL